MSKKYNRTLRELKREIKNNLSINKAPGYDSITEKIIKKLPEKGIRKLQVNKCGIKIKICPKAVEGCRNNNDL